MSLYKYDYDYDMKLYFRNVIRYWDILWSMYDKTTYVVKVYAHWKDNKNNDDDDTR